MTDPDAVPVLGVGIHPITRDQLVDLLADWATGDTPRRAYHANAHSLNLASENTEFKQSLNDADLVYCDGFGVKWAARALGHPLPDRMTAPDWIDQFLGRLSPHAPVFLLGDTAEVVSKCAELMSARHPGLSIAGTHHGFFDLQPEENDLVARSIRESNTRVLLVGMGMPRQEFWIDSNIDSLGISLALPVGALFQYYAGAKRRAPQWMTEHGLEWLGRLAYDPKNTLRRYIVGNPKFVARVARERLIP